MEDRSNSSSHKTSLNNFHQSTPKKANLLSSAILKLLGRNKRSVLLQSLNSSIDNSQKNGLISAEGKKMIKNIINIEDTKVGDVMTPRTDIVAVQYDASLEDIKKLIVDNEHSRVPVFKRNLDNVIGFIHGKDLAKFIGLDGESKEADFRIQNIIRKVLYVPRSMRVIDLLLKMRSSRVHISIVLDEYGGTDGLVSIEDIMEEIVGEIEDEHDMPGDNIYLRIKEINKNTLQVGGRVEIEKISEFLEDKIAIEDIESDFDTIGGLAFFLFKKVPEVGEIFNHSSGISFKILDADARSIKLIEIIKPAESE
ncbi:MAG: hypothetical protein K0R25_365 [Rickettsiaceae bacterium]|jgi:CBS domain containing-hemolysin-like protein|nr:hypothetical protein [Rickettsiaceae bacterium]